MNTKLHTITLALLASASLRAAPVAWTASSGLFPNEIACPYTLIDTATPENPVLTSILTLSTDETTENMHYVMGGADLSIPANLLIEFRMRYVSGSSNVSYRAAGTIQFETLPFIGNLLCIGQDAIFLQSAIDTAGPSVSVDTDGAFHDYRINVSGTALGSTVKVFYDGNQLLNGFLINDPNTSPQPVISWGEGSIEAQGVLEFESFSHNACAVPEPASTLLLVCSAPLLFRRVRLLHRDKRNAR